MRTSIVVLALAAGIAASPASAGAVNLIANGDFTQLSNGVGQITDGYNIKGRSWDANVAAHWIILRQAQDEVRGMAPRLGSYNRPIARESRCKRLKGLNSRPAMRASGSSGGDGADWRIRALPRPDGRRERPEIPLQGLEKAESAPESFWLGQSVGVVRRTAGRTKKARGYQPPRASAF